MVSLDYVDSFGKKLSGTKMHLRKVKKVKILIKERGGGPNSSFHL